MTHPYIPADVSQIVHSALDEDIGSGDLTSQLLPEDAISSATVTCREDAVMCGIPWFDEVYRQLDPDFNISWHVSDGDKLSKNKIICQLSGNTRVLVSGERTALNFIQLLSGTATVTYEYVQLIKGTDTRLLDTRKTIPGLRTAQKYAVACGGGKNHRMGLYDAILIKENHISAAGSIKNAYINAVEIHKNVEIEVESIDELQQALNAGAKQILLDNFTREMMQEAVSLSIGKATLEVSGGVTRETIRPFAETGVDFISVGALTKNVRAIDFSMRIEN
ncbi:MAG: carboxylating nicotinate-nucleotide diphosphorylase [Gammaproteobacteria bacterium]|nr:carboxylating nicotinate-nucleotide diphosphorylase [Gammaproteobacteria bacterium]